MTILSVKPRSGERRLRSVCCALALVLFSACGLAQAQDATIPWRSLSAEQRAILADTESHWDQLEPGQQRRLQDAADRWADMSEEQRTKTRERIARWKAMPPERRKALREHARRLRELPPEQRQRLHEFRKEFRALPKETQQQFRDCQRRQHGGETRDCREIWPAALREKYADLPEPPARPRRSKGPQAVELPIKPPPPEAAD